MVLIDTITLTSTATSVTFDGLNGNNDGTYYITGRVSYLVSNPVLLMRPNGLSTNLTSVMTGGIGSSTTGWLLGAWIIPEGSTPDGDIYFNCWIYPEENKGGSSSTLSGRRHYNGTNVQVTATVATVGTTATNVLGGTWQEASTAITSLEIVDVTATMQVGSSFSLYYIEDAD